MELISPKCKVCKKYFCGIYGKHTAYISCPFGRHCSTDSSVCGYVGYYDECPRTNTDCVTREGGGARIN